MFYKCSWSEGLNIIFVADIFGLTDEFKHLCQQVVLRFEESIGTKCQFQLLGPYQQQPVLFATERHAYQYFMANVTLAGYVKKLEKILSLSQQPGTKKSDDNIIIGFSVGGSAIWQLLSETAYSQSLAAICFYSSQIRYMTELTPRINTRLIFPVVEQHFSITELQIRLQKKPTVTIETSQYLHGFMNKCSMNYDSDGYQYYIQRLADLLSMQCTQLPPQVND